jgi:hypothetical protein
VSRGDGGGLEEWNCFKYKSDDNDLEQAGFLRGRLLRRWKRGRGGGGWRGFLRFYSFTPALEDPVVYIG